MSSLFPRSPLYPDCVCGNLRRFYQASMRAENNKANAKINRNFLKGFPPPCGDGVVPPLRRRVSFVAEQKKPKVSLETNGFQVLPLVQDKELLAADPAPGDDTLRARLLPLSVQTCWISAPDQLCRAAEGNESRRATAKGRPCKKSGIVRVGGGALDAPTANPPRTGQGGGLPPALPDLLDARANIAVK